MAVNGDNRAVALFGVGRIGKLRLHNIVKDKKFVLKYVVDISKDIVNEVCRDHDISSVTALDLQEKDIVFEDEEVVGIFVCTPTSTHEDLIVRGLNAGKHVFCEKPLSISYAVTRKCCQLAKEKGLILHCSMQRRFDPSFREVYNRASSGEIGQVTTVKSISKDPEPPSEKIMREAGCTVFFDSAIHDIDIVCWLAQQWPTSVYAMGHAWRTISQELCDSDVINILLKFPNGVIGSVDLSRYCPAGYDQRIEVSGTAGMLQVDNGRRNLVNSYSSEGCNSSKFPVFFQDRYSEAFDLSTKHFLRALEGTEHNEINEETILNLMKVVSCCEESWRKGQSVNFEPDLI